MIALTYCIAAVFLHLISLLKLLLNILKNKSTLVWFAKICMLTLPEPPLALFCGVILTFSTLVFICPQIIFHLFATWCRIVAWKAERRAVRIFPSRCFEAGLRFFSWKAAFGLHQSAVSAVWSRYLWSIFPQHFIPKALCLNIHWQTAVLL